MQRSARSESSCRQYRRRLAATAFLTVLVACASGSAGATTAHGQWLDQYCSRCHNDDRLSGGFTLSAISTADLAAGQNLGAWEDVLRRTSSGEMPPRDRPQPAAETRAAFTQWLETSLDNRAVASPDPGRATLRRLNRAEYANAVRDLLALDVDIADSLPTDDSGYGFDNIADVLSVSPTLMDRYLVVARRLSRLAVGRGPDRPFVTTYAVPKDGSVLNQGIPSWFERASDELPLGSRGGAAFRYYAPHDATYEIIGWLNANTNNEVDRMPETRVSLRVPLKAGTHGIGITFARQQRLDQSVQTLHNDVDYIWRPVAPPALLPLSFVVDGAQVGQTTVPSYFLSARFSQANFPRDVLQIDVDGPYDIQGPGHTPSRERIFRCRPTKPSKEEPCARRIVGALARQAWRRPVGETEIAPLMQLYAQAREHAGFEQGIEAAIEGLLVSPDFLFLYEQDPAGSEAGAVHPVTDLEFAARLALFLWSSLPDDELLDLAATGQLRRPAVLEKQIDRMLGDARAQALTSNFAGQWLYLRNLDLQRPDVYQFPNFNTRLRRAMKQETELFFESIVRENRSVLDFIGADYTFLNEALAEHYGIQGIKGPAFRRVALDPASQRGGLLGQGSILTVTSYANHTSVVKRGQWILTNLLSSAPPPPPPNVPALRNAVDGRALSAREQLELHRSEPACASCHVRMDPLGYALENFDAVGAWRTQDSGRPIDVAATLPDGTPIVGLPGLRKVLLDRKDEFTRAFTERLLTYAMGRGVESADMPTVRAIARKAANDEYRIRTVIRGIVESTPFNLRRTPQP
jgi:mono/diheme cytochrome c family protein